MDYDILLAKLSSISSELETYKANAEDIYNEFNSCYLSQITDAELSNLSTILKQPIERLKKGFTNSSTWLKNYNTELNNVEDGLAGFSGGLTAPTEFTSEFVDMFGKVTMPIIKTGGDTHANAVGVIHNISINSAMEKYKDEYENAYKNYASDSTFMTITKNSDGSYVTHVIVTDPSQIHKGYANGGYGNGLETTSAAATRYGWVVGVNGSHFNYSNGTQDINREKVQTNRVAINDGKIASNSGKTAGGLEICITKDGKFFTAPSGMSAQELLNKGVVQTYSSHEVNLLENGVVQTAYPGAMATVRNRTVIGMVRPGEYYIYSGNSSATQAATLLQQKGCVWAKSLDQGGSVSLATGDESVKKSASSTDPYGVNGERKVGDFLYFADV